jgi:hypothetical protein
LPIQDWTQVDAGIFHGLGIRVLVIDPSGLRPTLERLRPVRTADSRIARRSHRAYARRWRTYVPYEPRTHVRGQRPRSTFVVNVRGRRPRAMLLSRRGWSTSVVASGAARGGSQNEPAEIFVFGKGLEPLADEGLVDDDVFVGPVGGVEAQVFEHALENGMEPACANVLG